MSSGASEMDAVAVRRYIYCDLCDFRRKGVCVGESACRAFLFLCEPISEEEITFFCAGLLDELKKVNRALEKDPESSALREEIKKTVEKINFLLRLKLDEEMMYYDVEKEMHEAAKWDI